ncbi:ATP-binding protein [Microvirga yunnanensis]|uniref:ATP-binding protein n=1 Tax=Microvirga yunnanensis TaxID=2953740 RepID=UPI0021CA560B|nr:ATP-binding protein [Microvirga sp. HBU65207]
MTSIRTRLFIILVTATGIVWLCAAAWVYAHTQRQLQTVLDNRLMEAARMVSSLVEGDAIALAARGEVPVSVPETVPLSYERQLSCQIWSFDGRLIGRSSGAPEAELSNEASGFSEREVGGEPWRVYAVADRDKGIRVLVGDRIGLRDRLVTELVGGLLLPAALIVPLLAFLIWASVGRGLGPLRRLTHGLEARGAEDLCPISIGNPPAEIRPVVEALNGLFGKVAAAREHERSFTAFAAHELRTPLAGLRTQVQVALAAKDAETREGALRQTLVAVDRTTRLVRQLLEMSALDVATDDGEGQDIRVGRAIEEITAGLGTGKGGVAVEIDPALYRVTCCMNRELFHLVVRNLHENAVQHSPAGGRVRWFLDDAVHPPVVAVEDDGPGIPEDEISRVTDRFFRGRHRSAVGSGLGLAIVEAALKRAKATFVLRNRWDGSGLRAGLGLPMVSIERADESARRHPAATAP